MSRYRPTVPAPVDLPAAQCLRRTDTWEGLPTRYAPLWWHVKGLSFTATGYGGRIPTAYMVRIPGSPRWRRVYCAVWSNAGTCYVEDRTNRKWIVVVD